MFIIFELNIDVPTLIFINGVLAIVAAVMLTANWQMNKQVAGVEYWAITQWLWAFGLLLYIPRGVWPDFISIVLANFFMVVGSFALLRGISKFVKVPSTPVSIELFCIALMTFGYFYLTYIEANLASRVVMLSLFSFIIMLRSLYLLWPTITNSAGVGVVVGVGFSFHALFFLSRAVFTLSLEGDNDFVAGNGGAAWMLIEALVFIFWSTLSFALLTNYRLQQDLQSLADRDPLTNLLNRRAIYQDFLQNLSSGKTKSACVLLMDLDRFKTINDKYGHAAGDKVLKQFSRTINAILPGSAIIGRTGGEEFIAVLNNQGLEAGKLLANQICQEIRGCSVKIEEQDINYTVSIGVSSGEIRNSSDLREIVNNADKAMYEAKGKGRDCFTIFRADS